METTDEIDVWQDRLIHYVSSNGVVYLVMADDSVGRRMPFAFLAEVERRVSLLAYFLPSFFFAPSFLEWGQYGRLVLMVVHSTIRFRRCRFCWTSFTR